MKVKYHPKAEKFLKSRNEPDYSRLKKALDGLGKEPPQGDIRPLEGYKDEFRLRKGFYRALFHYDIDENGDKIILIDHIDIRGQAYKG
jgi:mRNA interferase RelE/StbE